MAGKRILVVDDMPNVARVFATALGTEGYEVATVTSGEQGFDATVFGQYDLVFMDLHMPRLNGVEAIRALRMVNHGIKVVVLSGHVDSFARELEEEDVDAILHKPLSLEDLRGTARRLIGPAQE